MIHVSGHARSTGSQTFAKDSALPLFINCCGYQKYITKDYTLQRPSGRLDYQLLYIYKGCGHFCIDNQWKIMPAGSLILYLPSEPQIYTYYSKDNPEIYWIHFTGQHSLELLEEHHIQTCYIGIHRSLAQLFNEIILELQVHKPYFQSVALGAFFKMLPLIERYHLSQSTAADNNVPIEKLVIELNKRYMNSWNLASMADYCHLSPYYFSRQFKEATGTPPISYLNNLRIEKAKEFLLTESLSISEVSTLVGYKDPLYFSRLFKKITGSSPKVFHGNRRFFDESTLEGTSRPSYPDASPI